MSDFVMDTGWFKSSRSTGGSDNCVEVRITGWFKSSRSTGSSDNCVEVNLSDSVVRVRDSKAPDGAVLAFDSGSWGSFVRSLREKRVN